MAKPKILYKHVKREWLNDGKDETSHGRVLTRAIIKEGRYTGGKKEGQLYISANIDFDIADCYRQIGLDFYPSSAKCVPALKKKADKIINALTAIKEALDVYVEATKCIAHDQHGDAAEFYLEDE